MKWTRLPSQPIRIDLLTREMVEIKNRFTVAYLETAWSMNQARATNLFTGFITPTFYHRMQTLTPTRFGGFFCACRLRPVNCVAPSLIALRPAIPVNDVAPSLTCYHVCATCPGPGLRVREFPNLSGYQLIMSRRASA